MFDSVIVRCPECGEVELFQSKGGDCFGGVFELHEASPEVLSDVNRHSPYECTGCGVYFKVNIQVVATSVRS